MKARSPEKGKPEEKDPDKSPTKKQEGSSTRSLEAGEDAPGFGVAREGRGQPCSTTGSQVGHLVAALRPEAAPEGLQFNISRSPR